MTEIYASGRPADIYVHFLEAKELAMSASGRPAVIYVHFLEASELAMSASRRPTIIYVHSKEAKERPKSWLCPLLGGLRLSMYTS